MVVNTESVVGYNNKLKKATTFMRIGVNSDLNIPVRRSTQKHNLGSRAVKLPHSGVETKDSGAGATAELEKAKHRTKEKQVVKSRTKETQVSKSKTIETRDSETRESSETKTVSTSHETNLNVLIIVAGGLAWFLFR